jgi:hypothetical protein
MGGTEPGAIVGGIGGTVGTDVRCRSHQSGRIAETVDGALPWVAVAAVAVASGTACGPAAKASAGTRLSRAVAALSGYGARTHPKWSLSVDAKADDAARLDAEHLLIESAADAVAARRQDLRLPAHFEHARTPRIH